MIGGIQLGPPAAAAGGLVPSGAPPAAPGAGDVAATGEFAAWLMAGLGDAVSGHARPSPPGDTAPTAAPAAEGEVDDGSVAALVTGVAPTLPFVVTTPVATPLDAGADAPTIPTPDPQLPSSTTSASPVAPFRAGRSMAPLRRPTPESSDGAAPPGADTPAAALPAHDPIAMPAGAAGAVVPPADVPVTDAASMVRPRPPAAVPPADDAIVVPHRGPAAARRGAPLPSGVTPVASHAAVPEPRTEAAGIAPAFAAIDSPGSAADAPPGRLVAHATPVTPATSAPSATPAWAPPASGANPAGSRSASPPPAVATSPARRARERGEPVEVSSIVPPAQTAAPSVAGSPAPGRSDGPATPVAPTLPVGVVVPSPRLRRGALVDPAATTTPGAPSQAIVAGAERGATVAAAVQRVLAGTAPTEPGWPPDRRQFGETLAPAVLAATPAAAARDLPAAGPTVQSPAALGTVPLDDVLPTQIIRSIRLQWQTGLGEARVQLRPEYLGEMTVAVKVDQGAVTATLYAETPEVRRWIEAHSGSLRDALAEQGLRLDRLVVAEERPRHDASADRRQRQAPDDDDPARRRRGRAHDADPRFEFDDMDLHERTYA